MQDINIRFEKDSTLDHIEVVIYGPEDNSRVSEIIAHLYDMVKFRINATDVNGCTCVIDEKDIITVSSDHRYTKILTSKGLFTVKRSLQSMEEQLNKKNFLRVSRYEIVNTNKIKRFDFTLGGTLRIEFEDGMETWASRRYIPVIKNHLSVEEES